MKIKLLFLCVFLSVISIASWSILVDNKIKINVSIPTNQELKDIRKSYEYHQEPLFKTRLSNNQSKALVNILDSINFSTKLGVYNFVHSSFVPLIYSYDVKDSTVMEFFSNFFSLEKLIFVIENKLINPMEKTQYMYLNLEYIRRNRNMDKLILKRNKNILTQIEKTLLKEWKHDKGEIWQEEAFHYQGRRSRIASILLHKIPFQSEKSFHTAITDFELFCLMTGCSLASNQLKLNGKIKTEIEEFIVFMLQILKTQCKVYSDGRWLLQPGVWKDYSDYLFAGNTVLKENLTISKIDTISWDASHSARWPIFIHTLKSLFKTNTVENKFLTDFQKGLADQFMNKVVHQFDSIPRFNNFMDGWNGIYRYNYSTMKQGYAPYTCNKHVFLSWWKILDDERINKMYQTIELNYDYYIKEYKGEIKRQEQLFRLLISLK